MLGFSMDRHPSSSTHLLAADRKKGLSSLSSGRQLGSNGIGENCPEHAAGGRAAGDRIPGRRGKLRTAAELSASAAASAP